MPKEIFNQQGGKSFKSHSHWEVLLASKVTLCTGEMVNIILKSMSCLKRQTYFYLKSRTAFCLFVDFSTRIFCKASPENCWFKNLHTKYCPTLGDNSKQNKNYLLTKNAGIKLGTLVDALCTRETLNRRFAHIWFTVLKTLETMGGGNGGQFHVLMLSHYSSSNVTHCF